VSTGRPRRGGSGWTWRMQMTANLAIASNCWAITAVCRAERCVTGARRVAFRSCRARPGLALRPGRFSAGGGVGAFIGDVAAAMAAAEGLGWLSQSFLTHQSGRNPRVMEDCACPAAGTDAAEWLGRGPGGSQATPSPPARPWLPPTQPDQKLFSLLHHPDGRLRSNMSGGLAAVIASRDPSPQILVHDQIVRHETWRRLRISGAEPNPMETHRKSTAIIIGTAVFRATLGPARCSGTHRQFTDGTGNVAAAGVTPAVSGSTWITFFPRSIWSIYRRSKEGLHRR
jgi:hypothetical protein